MHVRTTRHMRSWSSCKLNFWVHRTESRAQHPRPVAPVQHIAPRRRPAQRTQRMRGAAALRRDSHDGSTQTRPPARHVKHVAAEIASYPFFDCGNGWSVWRASALTFRRTSPGWVRSTQYVCLCARRSKSRATASASLLERSVRISTCVPCVSMRHTPHAPPWLPAALLSTRHAPLSQPQACFHGTHGALGTRRFAARGHHPGSTVGSAALPRRRRAASDTRRGAAASITVARRLRRVQASRLDTVSHARRRGDKAPGCGRVELVFAATRATASPWAAVRSNPQRESGAFHYG